MESKIFMLSYPWDVHGYKPHVQFQLQVGSLGFCLNVVVGEKNPKRVEVQHQRDIYKDSCVEWFVNFLPDRCDRYFNFEVNANGAMYAAFRKDRYDYDFLTLQDIDSMAVRTSIFEDRWEVQYTVPFALISKYIPGYVYQPGTSIRTNFYKCGAQTEFPHYGIWKEYDLESPDFHRPELFGEIIV